MYVKTSCLHTHARTHTHTKHRMPEVERIQSVNDQLRREVGIERTRVSVSAKQYVREPSASVHPPLPAMLT